MKANEQGLLDYCKELGIPGEFFTAEELKAVPGDFSPSAFVQSVTGVDNVCERAAVLAAVVLVLLNTVWSAVPLGGMDDWLHFSDAWGTDRVGVWKYCLSLFGDFPFGKKLIGGGCGVLAALDVQHRYFPDAILDAAHCEYIQLLLNWGVLGLGAYLAWIVLALCRAWKKGGALAFALAAGLLGYGVQALVNIAQAPGISLFFVLLAVLRGQNDAEELTCG